MKTLEQIKNEISVKHGYFSLANLIASGHTINTLKVIDEMLILVQKECLKNSGNNIASEYDRITNENNIIK